jgi:hypothetical protein
MIVRDGGDGKESFAVLKEVQSHPLTNQVNHVDFYEVALGQKFRVEVPIRIKGKAAGIELGGLLEVLMRSLEVECTPDRVPEFIEVAVSPWARPVAFAGQPPVPAGRRSHGEGSADAHRRGPHAEGRGGGGPGRGGRGEAAEGASVAEGAEKEGRPGKEKEGAKEPAKKEKKEK